MQSMEIRSNIYGLFLGDYPTHGLGHSQGEGGQEVVQCQGHGPARHRPGLEQRPQIQPQRPRGPRGCGFPPETHPGTLLKGYGGQSRVPHDRRKCPHHARLPSGMVFDTILHLINAQFRLVTP